MSSPPEDQGNNVKPRPVTYFKIWEPWRESVIEQHRFYVDQGRNKLLSQFNNIEQEADKAAEHWLEKQSHHFDPDRDDPGSFEEDAYHEGIEYFRLLSELRDQTRLNIVAGMYHAWDKELRRWLQKEIEHWHRGPIVSDRVWKATFEEIVELLDSLGLVNHNAAYLRRLSACRYVVNVYKHGEGLSMCKLKACHPEYLSIQFPMGNTHNRRGADHTHLLVTNKHFDEFSNAIVEFWRMLPSKVSSETLNAPAWFKKAVERDRKTP